MATDRKRSLQFLWAQAHIPVQTRVSENFLSASVHLKFVFKVPPPPHFHSFLLSLLSRRFLPSSCTSFALVRYSHFPSLVLHQLTSSQPSFFTTVTACLPLHLSEHPCKTLKHALQKSLPQAGCTIEISTLCSTTHMDIIQDDHGNKQTKKNIYPILEIYIFSLRK